MTSVKWPLSKKLWNRAHRIVNTIAWKLVPTANVNDPKNSHWIWRFNNWVANHYTTWWAEEVVRRHE